MMEDKNKNLNSREIKFLTYCSRNSIDGQIKKELELFVASGLDWQALVFKAAKQGVASFLYKHLLNSEKIWPSIPQESKDTLKQFYYYNLGKNWLVLRELHKIISLLNRASIEVIVLKGASLLETVYKNIGLRPMSDVDLLVKQNDLPKIKSILQNVGYREPELFDMASLEKFGGEVYLYKEEGVFLDIHTSLSQYERFRKVFKIDLGKEIWTKSRKYHLREVELTALNPMHLIMHLCLHNAIAHTFSGLFRFCDIREVILCYQNDIDWQGLIREAEKFKIKKIVYYNLLFTQELFGQIVSAKIMDALRPKREWMWLKNIFLLPEKIFSFPDKEPVLRKYLSQLFLMDNFSDIPRIVFKGMFPSDEWLKYRYGIKRKVDLILYRLFHPLITIFNIVFINRALSFVKPTNPVSSENED